MFNVNYTLSRANGILNQDFDNTRIDGKARERTTGRWGTTARTSSRAASSTRRRTSRRRARLHHQRLAGLGQHRWLSGTPYTAGFSIPGIGNVNLTGSPDGYARIKLTGQEISKGYSSDPYNQFNVAAFTAPSTGSVGLESPRFTMRLPRTDPRPLDRQVFRSAVGGGSRSGSTRSTPSTP